MRKGRADHDVMASRALSGATRLESSSRGRERTAVSQRARASPAKRRICQAAWPSSVKHAAANTTGSTNRRPMRLNVASPEAPESAKGGENKPAVVEEGWPIVMDLPAYVPEQDGELLELVVVGAGPAGLAVASRVAASGYKVVLVDPDPLGR